MILSYRQVRETINGLFHEFDPEVVGLSVMTFQRQTAHRIVDLARALKPGVKIVVGGYDPSLAPDAYEGMGWITSCAVKARLHFANLYGH